MNGFSNEHLNQARIERYKNALLDNDVRCAAKIVDEIHQEFMAQRAGLLFLQRRTEWTEFLGQFFQLYGDLNDLQESNRSQREARRKSRQVETKIETERLAIEKERTEVFRSMKRDELDRAYFQSLNAGDMTRAQDIINEAARRKGYILNNDFRTDHSAPAYDTDDKNLSEIAVGAMADYLEMARRGDQNNASFRVVGTAIDAILNDSAANVTVYRAVPDDLQEGKIRNGDWVTLSEEYAHHHGANVFHGQYRILCENIPGSDLWWDGNDINEWGYDDQREYRYKNTLNNRKLNDLITRDDSGNIIPPSRRFEQSNSDIRYRAAYHGSPHDLPHLRKEKKEDVNGELMPMVDTVAKCKMAMISQLLDSLNIQVQVLSDLSCVDPSLIQSDRISPELKGWYNASDGSISVILSTHDDPADIQRTILHEGVAHKGLDELLGRDKANQLYERIYDSLPVLEREKLQSRYAYKDEAGAEYVAMVAENYMPPNLLARIITVIRDFFREIIGIPLKISDSDIHGLLYRSHEHLSMQQTTKSQRTVSSTLQQLMKERQQSLKYDQSQIQSKKTVLSHS